MKLYSQIENAQLENKTSDYSSGVVGRIWWRTDIFKAKIDDGTNIRALLRNDGYAVFGNNATANNNIRFHRGASGVLQFVTGGDTTAEGTLSTSLNQISGRLENYTNAGKPAFGNAGRAIWVTDLANLQVDTGSAWAPISTGNRIGAIYDFVIGSAAQVTSGDATHSSWASAISAASSGNTIRVLEGSWTENVTINKQLWIEGSGYGSNLTGSITFTNASDRSYLSGVRASGDVTLNSGAILNRVENVWLASGKNFYTEFADNNYIDGFTE